MPTISLFGNIYNTVPIDNLDLNAYLNGVKSGQWEDEVHKIRIQNDETIKDKMKRHLERVTFSGTFSKRTDDGLLEHSSLIAIDLDDLKDPEITKLLLSDDKYVYAAFVSSGGKGLTILFRINKSKHRESFLGISEYLLLNYGLLADPGSISPVKPFGVTFDPFLHIAEHTVPIFTTYPKEKKEDKIPNFAFIKDDFERLISEITKRNINLCEDYSQWLKIGFAFAEKFGENGRDYFHMVSQISSKYNKKRTDDQFRYCLRSKKLNLNIASIKTFYFYCKEAGLQITSEKAEKVKKATKNGKAAGLSKEQIIINLKKFDGIEGVDEVVHEVFDSPYSEVEGDTVVEQLEIFLSSNYEFQRNIISRYIEQGDKRLEQKDLNTIYISAKKIIKNVNYDLFERLMTSDFVPSYNPLTRYFEKLKPYEREESLISKLAGSIVNDIQPYTEYFFKKWIVSIVSSAYGTHSPLMFVLSGEKQGTGKTEFFRRLIPAELKPYYAESKLDAGKDDEILMTQKLIIMDDEMTGKSKREILRLRELTSKEHFDLREPYGRINVSLKRLAVLCATTNSKDVLRDPFGNRRVIPVPVDDVNKRVYNSIDKNEVFAEAYSLWKSGFDWQVISSDDKQYLNKYEFDFTAENMEKELILRFFSKDGAETPMTATEIKAELEKLTQQKLSLDMIGRHLAAIGYERKSVRRDGQSSKMWIIKRVNRPGDYTTPNSDITTKEKNNGNGYEPIEGEGF
jgi:predicted P-loop ATPase